MDSPVEHIPGSFSRAVPTPGLERLQRRQAGDVHQDTARQVARRTTPRAATCDIGVRLRCPRWLTGRRHPTFSVGFSRPENGGEARRQPEGGGYVEVHL